MTNKQIKEVSDEFGEIADKYKVKAMKEKEKGRLAREERDKKIKREYYRNYGRKYRQLGTCLRSFNLRKNSHYSNGCKRTKGDLTFEGWILILERDGYKCLKCGKAKDLTVDMVKPLSKGGLFVPSNIQTLCFSCNSKKGNKTLDYRKTL